MKDTLGRLRSRPTLRPGRRMQIRRRDDSSWTAVGSGRRAGGAILLVALLLSVGVIGLVAFGAGGADAQEIDVEDEEPETEEIDAPDEDEATDEEDAPNGEDAPEGEPDPDEVDVPDEDTPEAVDDQDEAVPDEEPADDMVGTQVDDPGVPDVGPQRMASGEPRLEVFAPDPVLSPGETTELTLQIANDGRVSSGASPEVQDLLTTARNVRIEVDADDAPIEVRTERHSVGSITDGQPREVSFLVEVPEDADPGEYELDVSLRYRHAAQISGEGVITNDRSRSVTRTVDVEIDDGPRFVLRDAETDAQIGDAGPMTVELENVGNEAAEDLTVVLESTSARVGFGESPSESASVSRLEPGETTTLEYDLAFAPRASLREYPLDATITFEDERGIAGVDERPRVNVTPIAKQTFSIDDVESTLRVGEDGDLEGTVTNTGPVAAESVVVQFADESPNVVPIESSAAVGSLEPGESEQFRLPVEIARDAEPMPRTFDLAIRYRNVDNEMRMYEDVDATVEIAERRDEFLLEIPTREIQAGESTLLDVEVTNNLNQTVTDVEAKLFTDDPLDSDEDEGYVQSLDPGETTTITFELNADSGAIARTYPVSMDFRYDDERGTSKTSDTYRVGIDVTESDDEGFPWILVGGIVVLVALIAAVAYWQRNG